jgi:hypothetical protein
MFLKTNNKRENNDMLVKSPTNMKKTKPNDTTSSTTQIHEVIKLFKIKGFHKHNDFLFLDLKSLSNEDLSVECFLHDTWYVYIFCFFVHRKKNPFRLLLSKINRAYQKIQKIWKETILLFLKA